MKCTCLICREKVDYDWAIHSVDNRRHICEDCHNLITVIERWANDEMSPEETDLTEKDVKICAKTFLKKLFE